LKVKLDLHTHVGEATGMEPVSVAVAERIIQQIKSRGIDGIGITDHHNKDYAFAFKELVDTHFPNEVIIIPGWEINVRPSQSPFDEYHMGELFLSGESGTRVFRSYCHPGYYTPNVIIEDGVQAIEIANANHNWHIRKKMVEEIASNLGLLLFEVSDAHNVEDIGSSYTEVDLDELYRRAIPLQ
jgi:histidinol phosphatase-like PHP family hydrolase